MFPTPIHHHHHQQHLLSFHPFLCKLSLYFIHIFSIQTLMMILTRDSSSTGQYFTKMTTSSSSSSMLFTNPFYEFLLNDRWHLSLPLITTNTISDPLFLKKSFRSGGMWKFRNRELKLGSAIRRMQKPKK